MCSTNPDKVSLGESSDQIPRADTSSTKAELAESLREETKTVDQLGDAVANRLNSGDLESHDTDITMMQLVDLSNLLVETAHLVTQIEE